MRKFFEIAGIIFGSLVFVSMMLGFGNYAKAQVGKAYVPPPTNFSNSGGKEERSDSLLMGRVITINDDEITGKLKTIKEDIVSLESPLLPHGIKIPLHNVRGIYFGKPLTRISSDRDQIVLSGEEFLSGKLVSMNRENITLRTAYADTLNIKRNMALAIVLGSEYGLAFSDDFTEKDDKWTVHSGPWQIKNGKMHQEESTHVRHSGWYVSTAATQKGYIIYEWQVDACYYFAGGFGFFANSASNMYGGNAYRICFKPTEVSLQRVQNNSSNQVAECHFGQETKKIKFRVECDSETGKIKVWANSEVPIIDYSDPSPWKSGSYILLTCNNRPLSFDNIRITSGHRIPKDMEKGGEDCDLVCLTSNDRLSGELEKITEHKVTISTDYGRINLPRNKLSTVILNRKKNIKPELAKREANLILHNLDELTVDIQSLDENILYAESAYAGLLKIDLSAVKKILLSSDSSNWGTEEEEPRVFMERITTINHDKITGEVETINEDVIRLKSSFLAEEVRIPLRNTSQINFRRPLTESHSGRDHILLSGEDILSGEMVSMDKEKITLRTAYADTLNIKRNMALAIVLGSKHRLVFEDDFSEKNDKWTTHSGTWQIKNGKMHQEEHVYGRYISAAVTQKGYMNYEWEVESPQYPLSGNFAFFSSSAKSRKGENAYIIRFDSGHVYLQKAQNSSIRDIVHYYLYQKPRKIKFRVECDSETGRIKVWANSKNPVIRYTDSLAWESGSYILLIADRSINFDNVRITAGKGVPGDVEKGSEKVDLVHFGNKDRISGEVESITKDKITILTDCGKINLERNRVSAIIFNKKKIAKPKLSERAANLILHNLDKLTVDIQSLDEKILSAESPYADLLKIDRSAIKKILLPLEP